MTYESTRVALFGNTFQSGKNAYVRDILSCLDRLGVTVSLEEEFADFAVRSGILPAAHPYRTFGAGDCEADFAVSVGGDGTFLGTAARVGAAGIPILGVNIGRLGFLADVSPDNIAPAFEALCRGAYTVERRRVLAVEKDGKLSSFFPYALNEVAVLKHDNSSLIEISTWVDGHFLANYLADGLIVCTPTGSTGYSLSVGGPVLTPGSGTIGISPVAPHSLSLRPLVVRDDLEVRMEIRSRSHNFLLSADGRSESLPESTAITVRRAPHCVNVVKIQHPDFFGTLREKLMWGADTRG